MYRFPDSFLRPARGHSASLPLGHLPVRKPWPTCTADVSALRAVTVRRTRGVVPVAVGTRVRLLQMGVALVLRNIWVWLHFELLSSSKGEQPVLNLGLLRLTELMRWIAVTLEKELGMDQLPELEFVK